MEHIRVQDRPVHPECPVFGGGSCMCDELWSFWQGDDTGLDVAVKAARRREMRRRPVAAGEQLDLDLMPDPLYPVGDVSSSNELDGFWKESEYLRTMRRTLVSDDEQA